MSSNLPARRQPPAHASAELPLQRIRWLRPSFRVLARNWWAVVVWLGVIRLESTNMASSANTSGLLHAVLSFFLPHISGQRVEQLNEVLRKTGHFVGYGILGILVFFALRNTNRDRLAPWLLRRWGSLWHDLWRMEWVWLSMGMAVITAALDEIHQSFIPSRTGRWQDVVLDACGAAGLQIGVYFFSLWALNRRRQPAKQAELSSS